MVKGKIEGRTGNGPEVSLSRHMMECYCHVRVHHEIVPSQRNRMVIVHYVSGLQFLPIWVDIGATQVEQRRRRRMLFRQNWSCLLRLIGHVHTTSFLPGALGSSF